MATYDRWTDEHHCPCGAAVAIHWIYRAYNTSEPEIHRVVGHVVNRHHKSLRGVYSDCVDVLCGRCGTLLHESEAAKRSRPRGPAPVVDFFGRQVRR